MCVCFEVCSRRFPWFLGVFLKRILVCVLKAFWCFRGVFISFLVFLEVFFVRFLVCFIVSSWCFRWFLGVFRRLFGAFSRCFR